jgi:hypothetical protein
MSGYHSIIALRRLEEQVDKLGFMFAYPKGGYGGEVDMVALRPRDSDAVPIYSRDAEVFVGTLQQLEVWIRGVEWARNYDMMLRIVDDKKRAKAEVKERERQAQARKRAEQQQMMRVLKSTDRENLNPKK